MQSKYCEFDVDSSFPCENRKETFESMFGLYNDLYYHGKRYQVAPSDFVRDLYGSLGRRHFCYLYRETVTNYGTERKKFQNKEYDDSELSLERILKICRDGFSEEFCLQVKAILINMEIERKAQGFPEIIRFPKLKEGTERKVQG